MPSQRVSDEELEFRKRARRRLVGAVFCALVATAVLPFVLASKPKPAAGNVAILVPPDTGAAQTSDPTPASSADALPAAAADSHSATTGNAPAASAAAPAGDVASPRRYLVQVGTFTQSARARQLQARLEARGFKVFTDTVTLAGGAATRLRVGPYVSRADALAAQQRLEALHLQAMPVGTH